MIEDMRAALARVEAAPLPAPKSGRGLDVVEQWPELFDGLDDVQRDAIRQAFAANWHEGWTPNREDVADLAAHTRGDIDLEEYMKRARERAEAARTGTAG